MCIPLLLNDSYQVNTLLYADNLVILGESEELQTKLNQLTEYCKKWKLEINADKMMVFSRRGRLCNMDVKVNNVKVESVKSFKYLPF